MEEILQTKELQEEFFFHEDNKILKNYEISEIIIAENGKAYAYAEGLAEPKREIDGCEARQFIAALLKHRQQLKGKLQDEITRLDKEILQYTRTDNQLTADGYCKIDLQIPYKIDGIAQYDANGKPIVKKCIHQFDCKNAKKEA